MYSHPVAYILLILLAEPIMYTFIIKERMCLSNKS